MPTNTTTLIMPSSTTTVITATHSVPANISSSTITIVPTMTNTNTAANNAIVNTGNKVQRPMLVEPVTSDKNQARGYDGNKQPHTKTIKVEDLRKFFHLPILQVAKNLNICTTLLKRICRYNNIKKWPYRQVTLKK